MQPSFDFGHKCSLGHCHFVPTGEDATGLKLARKVIIYTPYFYVFKLYFRKTEIINDFHFVET